jgi:hypothetical protein
MKSDPSRDSVFAICYVYGYNPGAEETIELLVYRIYCGGGNKKLYYFCRKF